MEHDSNWQRIHPIYGVPIAAEQALEQPSIFCHVVRGSKALAKAPVPISTWINTNYFLWLLCAGLADDGIDKDWTSSFESNHRACWNEIQNRVNEIEGSYRFGLAIPPPPVFAAVITHVSARSSTSQSFKICSQDSPTELAPFSTSLPQHGIWGFWKFLSEKQQFASDLFDVVLDIKISRPSPSPQISEGSLLPALASSPAPPPYTPLAHDPHHTKNQWQITIGHRVVITIVRKPKSSPSYFHRIIASLKM